MKKIFSKILLLVVLSSILAPSAMAMEEGGMERGGKHGRGGNCKVNAFLAGGLSRRLTAEAGQEDVELMKLRFLAFGESQIEDMSFKSKLKNKIEGVKAISSIKLMNGNQVIKEAELDSEGSFKFEDINFELAGRSSMLTVKADISSSFTRENLLNLSFDNSAKITGECLASGDAFVVKGPYHVQRSRVVIVPKQTTTNTEVNQSSATSNSGNNNGSINTPVTTGSNSTTVSTATTDAVVALSSTSPSGQVVAGKKVTIGAFSLTANKSLELRKLTTKFVGDVNKVNNLQLVTDKGVVLDSESFVDADGYLSFNVDLELSQGEVLNFLVKADLTTGGKIKLLFQAVADFVLKNRETGSVVSNISGLPFSTTEISF